MADTDLTVRIFGKDVSASKTISALGAKAKKELGGISKIAAGVFAGFTVSAITAKVQKFASDSVNAFAAAGKETLLLQRYMGGTTEDASRLASALRMSGLDSATASRSFGIMSKFVSTAGTQFTQYEQKVKDAAARGKEFTGHLGGSATALAELGIAIKTPAGEMRSTQDILMDFADKMAALPPGVDKTTYALKAFGKSGMAMVPFLNKGSAGIRELYAQSDKLGTTLSDKDTQAVKDNIAAKRRWSETIRGLQISFGRNLLPAMTAVTAFIADKVLPAVQSFSRWAADNKPIMLAIAAVIGGVLVVAVTAYAISMASAAVATIAATWPILAIVAAVALLAVGFRYAWKHSETFRTVVKTAMAVVAGAFNLMWNGAKQVFGWLRANWKNLLTLLSGPVGIAVRLIATHWDSLRNGVSSVVSFVRDKFNAVVGFFRSLPGRLAVLGYRTFDFLRDSFRSAVNFIIRGWNALQFQIPGFDPPGPGPTFAGFTLGVPDIPMLANGGIVTRPTLALIGEAGPEAVVPLPRGNNRGGGGDTYNVTVNVPNFVGNRDELARTVVNAINNSPAAPKLRARAVGA